jgi:tRNA(Arg) A34 adenosine deaminase TadA
MKETDEKFIRLAVEQAFKGLRSGEGGPFGAVIVKEGEIVAVGNNRVTSTNDPTAHAEMLAISAACATIQEKYLNDCTLYVTLEPCAMCAGALVWSKISRVVFGAMDEKRLEKGELSKDEITSNPLMKEMGFDEFKELNSDFDYHIIFNGTVLSHQQKVLEKISGDKDD